MVTRNVKNGLLCAVAMLVASAQVQAAGEASTSMMSMASVKKAMMCCTKMPKDMIRYAWHGIQSDNPCAGTVWADRTFRMLGIAAVAYHGYVGLPKVYAYLKAKLEAQEAAA